MGKLIALTLLIFLMPFPAMGQFDKRGGNVDGQDIAPSSVTTDAITVTSNSGGSYIIMQNETAMPSETADTESLSFVNHTLYSSSSESGGSYGPVMPLYYIESFTEAVTNTSNIGFLTQTFSGSCWEITSNEATTKNVFASIQKDAETDGYLNINLAEDALSQIIIAFSVTETGLYIRPELPTSLSFKTMHSPKGSGGTGFGEFLSNDRVGISSSGVRDCIIVGVTRTSAGIAGSHFTVWLGNDELALPNTDLNTYMTDIPAAAGQWNLIRIDVDSSEYSVFINGQEAVSGTTSASDYIGDDGPMIFRPMTEWSEQMPLIEVTGPFAGSAGEERNFKIDEVKFIQKRVVN